MTIYALSSGGGRAGVAVIRVSGSRAGGALRALTGRDLPAPRRAEVAKLRDPRSGEVLDVALCLWFPAPRSFTGEDVAELHVHGGRAVIAGVLDALGRMEGLRPAEAGEFTRRAFDNGRLDLTEVEGLADLIDAETEAQRRQALRQMQGSLRTLYENWRGRLVRLLAHLEAEIDFPDEDLPDGESERAASGILLLNQEILLHLDDNRRGERLREGLYVAIVGAPNVGKSSLLNWLAGRDAAIVSATAGTTRDVIEVHLDFGGLPVVVADTAGLGVPGNQIEAEGVRRARDRAASADLKIVMFDAAAYAAQGPDDEIVRLVDGDSIVVFNKTDLEWPGTETEVAGKSLVPVSVKTGEGLDGLLAEIEREVCARMRGGAAPALTRARHRRALEECCAALGQALTATAPELVAEDVRVAVRQLGRITGRVDVEDVLDIVFRDFCIGK